MTSKILIVKTSAIGDVIQVFSVLEYLRKKDPTSQIDWVVEAPIAPLLRAHPHVNRVIEIETKKWRRAPFAPSTWRLVGAALEDLRSTSYDLIIDLQGNIKSAFVTGLAKGKVKLGFDKTGVQERGNLLATNRTFSLPADLSARERYVRLVQTYFQDPAPFIPSPVRLILTPSEQERLEALPFSSHRPRIILKTAVGSGKVMQDFDSESFPAEGHIPQVVKGPSAGNDSESKDCVNLPLPTAVFRIMVCFGSKWKNKQLKEETLIAFLEKIALHYDPAYFFVFGNQEEEAEAQRLCHRFSSRSQTLGGMSLPLWQALMYKMNLVLTVDSAALHLCGTTSAPSFSVFGPSLASMYKPMGERHGFVQGPCPYGRSFPLRCPILRTCPTGACMRELDPELLFARFSEFEMMKK